MAKDYYSVLGVARNATTSQIRDRFLDLARNRHPDRYQDSDKAQVESDFQAITEAFNILNNPERRRQHDLELARPETQRDRAADGKQAARVYLQRGVVAYREGNYLAAAENFDRATREAPDSASAWHNLARACRHQKRWLSRAGAAISRACELKPMNSSYHKLAGEIYAEAGIRGRAEHFFREALKWGGDDAEIQARLDELSKGGRSRQGGVFGRTS